ncbi:hypothetical protein EYF80_021014 [Liparis tanakae]|uniref:Uncharacterized protein n=1 Tax=Liparis tanakae TaxID=230148 RepID=A0A4Z2HSJ8_9TELE|nr:hypothetical protein EYF80_021014 [Liparis tanakae]
MVIELAEGYDPASKGKKSLKGSSSIPEATPTALRIDCFVTRVLQHIEPFLTLDVTPEMPLGSLCARSRALGGGLSVFWFDDTRCCI